MAKLNQPVLTREEELALAKRIEAGERALLRALLATDAGRRALRTVRDDLEAGRIGVDEVLRNAEQGRAASARQRAHVLRALAEPTRPVDALVERLVDLGLHPSALARIEAAVHAESAPVTARARERARAARKQMQHAKGRLIEQNLRLVVALAKRYRNAHFGLLDLIQEGNLGLMRAVDKFDHRRGYRLNTYAVWWVKQAIERAITDRAPTIRLPVHVVASRAKMLRARGELIREGGDRPTPEAVAAQSGLPVEKVRLILGLASEPVSLDAPAAPNAETRLGDLVANDTSPAPDDEVATARAKTDARALLGALTERERRVLDLRFGLDGAPERTLEEIGATMSLTRERIRQIEAVALQKLRQHCQDRGLRADERDRA